MHIEGETLRRLDNGESERVYWSGELEENENNGESVFSRKEAHPGPFFLRLFAASTYHHASRYAEEVRGLHLGSREITAGATTKFRKGPGLFEIFFFFCVRLRKTPNFSFHSKNFSIMFIQNEHVGDRSRMEDWRSMFEK